MTKKQNGIAVIKQGKRPPYPSVFSAFYPVLALNLPLSADRFNYLKY
jgi:hypothetical protein